MSDRAVVAISEDRQWLVLVGVPGRFLSEPGVGVYEYHHCSFELVKWNKDTGQDAHEVLEKFLEGRDGTTPDSDYPLRDLPTDRAEADDVHPGAGAGTGQ